MSPYVYHHASSQQPPVHHGVFGSRDLRVFNVLLFAGVVSFFIAYLALNNQAATKGFMIRSIEREISVLQDRRQELDLEVVTGQSMESIQNRLPALGLVPVSGVEYLSAAGGSVAVK